MRTRKSRFTLAALTAATLVLPLAVTGCANMGAKCGSQTSMQKGGAKCVAQCKPKSGAKCAGQCKPKCGTKSGAKCGSN